MIERVEQEELLDLGYGSDQDVAANLAEMQRINDLLGGTRALTRHLFPRLLLHRGNASVLDLGTGGAGLPALLVRWARRINLPLRVLAIDRARRNLRAAIQMNQALPGISFLQADAEHPPLPPASFDYVISQLFLHHFSPERVIRLLEAAYAISTRGMVMSDLVRGWLPFLAFTLAQPVIAHHELTRRDGLLSIRRAYTPGELLSLAIRAGLPDPRVYTHWPWRMTLVVKK